jgi:hypothetical protein
MYYDKVELGCRHGGISAVQTTDFRKPADRLAAFASLYAISVSSLQEDLANIRMITCANLYFNFLFGRSLLEAKTTDIPTFANSQTRYSAWNFQSEKPDFEKLRDLVLSLLPLL